MEIAIGVVGFLITALAFRAILSGKRDDVHHDDRYRINNIKYTMMDQEA